MATPAHITTDETRTILDAATADLTLLCWLHDREPDRDLLLQLAACPARDWFGLALTGEEAETGFDLLDQFLSGPECASERQLDELAADFADLYLTFGKRLAPNESYWLTDDHIERQEPMFDVREWYAHYGLKAENWRQRSDDHLVHQLAFVAELLRRSSPNALLDAGRFLDRHLLRWAKDFLGGQAARSATAFYAGLGLVTLAGIERIRNLLENLTGEPRKEYQAVSGVPDSVAAEGPFVPGSAPSW